MQKFNSDELAVRLEKLQGWTYENGSIVKTFVFKDFKEAFAKMTQIAFEAEGLNHHPDWENVYNRLTVRLNTHDVGGITQNDFDLAERIEAIAEG